MFLRISCRNRSFVLNYIIKANLCAMKLPEDQMKCILRPGVRILSDLFKKNNFDIRVAGGAVRDLLMGITPTDLDFATTATPTEMKEMFDKENVRILNLGGEKHGTITARIEEENFECTTLRIDKETDGRHAEVEFIRDWKLDAGRRDLTINALFLGLDGTVFDYFDGIKHLETKTVAFVGCPDQRIKEDFLRILRYFRFFGRIADDPSDHQQHTLDSIQRNCDGLSRISGERIWVEVKKIVAGRFGGDLIIKMVEIGIWPHIGLPEDFDCNNVKKVYTRLENCNLKISDINPMTLLASGFVSEDDANTFINRMKCSNKEKECLLFIIRNRKLVSGDITLKLIQDLIVDIFYKQKKGREFGIFVVTELIKYVGRVDLLKDINNDLIPQFPIKGGMLVGVVSNKRQIASVTNMLLEIWKDSDYSLNGDELLSQIERK